MLDKTRLRIAMQKSGRLSDESQELLARCGIKINLQQQRLIAFAENMPIDILRVRDDDIPGLVMDGVVDLGIIGENVLEEELLTRRAQGKTRVTSPCVAWTSAVAACRWPPRSIPTTPARKACRTPASPPPTRTC
ncbi:hypothetical protein GGER_17850 [Serratia rubidaea]